MQTRQIVLDTETTGLKVEDGHRIIEIGCVELINRRITGKQFHQYINPERAVDEGAFRVHGISQDFLADKPIFSNIYADFITFIQGAELIIHNAPFDVGFINHELRCIRHEKKISEFCRVLDTLTLARQLHSGQKNSLDALCKRYQIDLSNREFHGALLDANLLARVYLAMTGGQEDFFGLLNEELKPQSKRNPLLSLDDSEKAIKPHVICATDEENMLHSSYMEILRKKGECIWDYYSESSK